MTTDILRKQAPGRPSFWFAVAVAIWLIALGAGAVGIYQRLVMGHEAADYSSYIPWGLWVALYVNFISVSAGAFLISALVYVFGMEQLARVGKLALFTALVFLVSAVLLIWFDLGHMERFWKVYFGGNPASMMAWMVWLYTAYFVLLLVELWFALRADLVEWSRRTGIQGALASLLTLRQTDVSDAAVAADRQALRVLGAFGVPLAITFHGGVGALFGVVGAREFWNAPIVPIMFIVAALASGGAVLTFLVALFWPREKTAEYRDTVRTLGSITIGLLATYLLLLWAEYSITFYADIPASAKPLYQVLGGPYPWVFWVFQVGIGAVIPIALFVWNGGRSTVVTGVLSGFIAIGFVANRLNIVIPGLVRPQLEGLEEAFMEQGLKYDYFPTSMEWLVAIFAAAIAVALLYLGYRLLPLVTDKEA